MGVRSEADPVELKHYLLRADALKRREIPTPPVMERTNDQPTQMSCRQRLTAHESGLR